MFGSDAHQFFGNTFIRILLTLAIAIVVQAVMKESINHIVRRLVRRHHYKSKGEQRKRENTLAGIFSAAGGILLWVVAAIVMLAELHVNLTALVTGAGLFGVIIGFSAQNTLKDFFAGIFIIAENQYRIGDVVTLNAGGNAVSGVVEDLTIRITQLRDLDGNLHTVPNGVATVVTNKSFEYANVNIDINVAYDTDFEQARDIINKVGAAQAADAKLADRVIEPIKFLRVDSFNDSSVALKSIGKVTPGSQWDLAGDFRLRIKKAFDDHGIEIPFNTLVVRQAETRKK